MLKTVKVNIVSRYTLGDVGQNKLFSRTTLFENVYIKYTFRYEIITTHYPHAKLIIR